MFLAQDADGFVAGPGKPGTQAEVLHATARYAAEHDLMWRVWDLAGGIGNARAHVVMADPALRHAMVALIGEAREQDALAVEYLARVLDPTARSDHSRA